MRTGPQYIGTLYLSTSAQALLEHQLHTFLEGRERLSVLPTITKWREIAETRTWSPRVQSRQLWPPRHNLSSRLHERRVFIKFSRPDVTPSTEVSSYKCFTKNTQHSQLGLTAQVRLVQFTSVAYPCANPGALEIVSSGAVRQFVPGRVLFFFLTNCKP